MSTGHPPNTHRAHVPTQDSQYRRPATIAELAEKARENGWDPNRHLKHWLRTAELSRKYGKQYTEAGDFERAFIHLARAATIILEKMPTHGEYLTLLNPTQRHNLSLHGQETLDNLGKLKPVLLDRYDLWVARNPELANNPSIKPSKFLDSSPPTVSIDNSRNRDPREDLRREDSRRRENEEAEKRKYEEQNRGPSISRGLQEQGLKQKLDERRMQEQAGILQRQREAEASAHAAHREILMPPILPAPVSASQQNSGYPQPTTVVSLSQPPPNYGRHDVSQRQEEPVSVPAYPPLNNHSHPQAPAHPDMKVIHNRYQSQSMTTTSPPPPSMGHIKYPALMSQHQMKQGYVPSLHSMFQPPGQEVAPVVPESLLFQNEQRQGGFYSNSLPPPSVPINYPDYNRRHPPVPPHTANSQPISSSSLSGVDPSRITLAASGDLVSKDLKTIYLPKESLPRFLNVAAVNTSRNRETCGLLLGRDKRSRFIVTTLLIPKQHSTSDTCTMDEEELVMSFTEHRSLITLGWIHTHPTQSCFMSSVDLHTHSGFQRMLPESFAIVCAPASTPSFGIFRLTDPPGLQTILDCTAKEAFHPHPPVPIYTDADKGHVQIKDSLPLEIVDLRDL